MNNFITLSEISALTGFKPRTIRSWINTGYLRSVRGPTATRARHFVRRDDLLTLMKKMKMPADVIHKIKESK